jgi:dihydropteroate synthase
VEEGADILDVGGESTRPGAAEVPVEEELRRVIPVIERLARETSLPISVDTSKPEVMRAAVQAGAGMINDVYALRRDGALDAAAAAGVPVVLTHMQGEPRTMQEAPHYDDLLAEVHRFLADRVLACEMAGIGRRRIVIDPGYGFGKTTQHNLLLLRQQSRLLDLGLPLLAGLSRKRSLGEITGREVGERVFASVAAAVLAAEYGARILRVHDVAATVDALKVWAAVAAQPAPAPAAPAKPGIRWPDDD